MDNMDKWPLRLQGHFFKSTKHVAVFHLKYDFFLSFFLGANGGCRIVASKFIRGGLASAMQRV